MPIFFPNTAFTEKELLCLGSDHPKFCGLLIGRVRISAFNNWPETPDLESDSIAICRLARFFAEVVKP